MSLKKCKECGNEVSTKAKNCPKCGAPVKTNVSCLGAIGIIILVFIVIGIIVSNQSVDNSQVNQNTPQTKQNNPQINPKKTSIPKANSKNSNVPRRGLKVIKFDWETGEYGSRSLVGKVKNDSDKQYSYVQVEFNLYDKSGAQVGSTMANVNNLEPNGTWKFEAVVLQNNASSAKLKGITSF